MIKKHPQFILAAEATAFARDGQSFEQPLVQIDSREWAQAIQSHLTIRERAHLEEDPRYRQLLPYVVFFYQGPGGKRRYAAYRRGNGVGEQALVGNASIGFGGHIDLVDVVHEGSVLNLEKTIVRSATRELVEEVLFNDHWGKKFSTQIDFNFDNVKALILDDSNQVGRVHVALVTFVPLPSGALSIAPAENELIGLGMLTAEELLAPDMALENWTRIILESELGR